MSGLRVLAWSRSIYGGAHTLMQLGRVRRAANVIHGLVGAVSVYTNTFTLTVSVL